MVVKINRTARNAFFTQNLSIGTKNITEYVDNVRAGYSPLDLPRQSVTYMTGTMVLKFVNDNIDFDDRYTNNWTRGTTISMFNVDPSNGETRRVPICGTAYILNSQYDLKDTLTIQFGDILTLLTYRTALQTGVCLELGTNTRISTVVFNLLLAAGVPLANIDSGSLDRCLTGFLTEPIFVSGNQSYIQLAASFCSSHSAFLYATNTGIVQCIGISGGLPIHDVDARDIQVYGRRNAPESAIKEATFTWRDATVTPQTGTFVSDDRVNEGTNGGVRTVTTYTVNYSTRTVTTNTDVYRYFNPPLCTVGPGCPGWFLSGTDTITETYEADPNPVPDANPLKTLDECFPEDNARILTRSTDKKRDNAEILSRWTAINNIALTASTHVPLVGQQTWENTTETYTYTPSTGIPTKIEKVTTTNYKLGWISPLLADTQLQNPGRVADPTLNGAAYNPDLLVPSRTITEIWNAEQVGATYTLNRYVHEIIPLSDAEANTIEAQDSTITTINIANQVYTPILVESNEQPNQSLPTFETIPPEFVTTYTENSVIVGGTGTIAGLEVIAEFNLGDYRGFGNQSQIALETVKQINGRIYSMTISDNPYNIDPSLWSVFLPLFRGVVREPNINRRNFYSVYKMDSPTVSLNQTEFVIGYIGILEGYLDEDLGDKTAWDGFIAVNDLTSALALLRTPPTLPTIVVIP